MVRTLYNDPFWPYIVRFVHFNPPYVWMIYVQNIYGNEIAQMLLNFTVPPVLDSFFALLEVYSCCDASSPSCVDEQYL